MNEVLCPYCLIEVGRDEADIGIGIIYGPYGCSCGWSESVDYDTRSGPRFAEDGGRIDSRGGVTPR